MIEYLLIITATILFSIQFLFTKKYQLSVGEGSDSAFFHRAVSPLLLIFLLLVYNGFKIEFSLFSTLMAVAQALVMVLLSIITMKALSRGSVYNYSLYLLSGGMVIPVIYGALTGDNFGIWKIFSIVVILLCVALKYNPKEKVKKSTYFLFFGVFLLNGLAGVIATAHQQNFFNAKTVSSVGFSILTSVLSCVFGGIAFLINRKSLETKPPIKKYFKGAVWALIDGFINGTANLLLLIALLKTQPSNQYPIVTGGSIFLSALLGYVVYKEKLSKKGLAIMVLAIIGSILIVL